MCKKVFLSLFGEWLFNLTVSQSLSFISTSCYCGDDGFYHFLFVRVLPVLQTTSRRSAQLVMDTHTRAQMCRFLSGSWKMMSCRAQEWRWRSRSLSCRPPSLHDTTTTLKHLRYPSTPRHHEYLSTLWLHNIPQNQDKKRLNCKMVTICFFLWLTKDQHNVLIFPHTFFLYNPEHFLKLFLFFPIH